MTLLPFAIVATLVQFTDPVVAVFTSTVSFADVASAIPSPVRPDWLEPRCLEGRLVPASPDLEREHGGRQHGPYADLPHPIGFMQKRMHAPREEPGDIEHTPAPPTPPVAATACMA